MGYLQDNWDERNRVEDEIRRIESGVSSTAKPRLSDVQLDEIDYTPPSDEYLKKRAESSLNDYYKSGRAAIEEDSAANAAQLSAKRDALSQGRDSEISALADSYKNAVRAVDNDAIKRGLARSSVAAVNRGELEKEYLAKNADIASGYGKRISQLDEEIASVDGKLRSALNDFNLTYATKLNEKLNELKAERDKKVEEVTKFNNSVREKQAKLDEARARAESDLYSAAIRQQQSANSADGLTDKQRDDMYRSIYDTLDSYLGSLDPVQAKMEITNHTMYREHLSDYYYYRLFDKYGRVRGGN